MPAARVYDQAVTSSADAWSDGPDGSSRWNGRFWAILWPPPVHGPVNAVNMLSPTDGWAVGSTGTIAHYR